MIKKLKFALPFLIFSISSFGQMDSLKGYSGGMTNEIQSFTIHSNSNSISAKVKSWINKAYENPDKVVSGWDVDGNLTNKIKVSGFQPKIFHYQNIGLKYYVDVKYEIEINIEDSLVRFNFHITNMSVSPYQHSQSNKGGMPITFGGFQGLFTNDNHVRTYWAKTNAVKDLENFVNSLAFSFYRSVVESVYSSDEALLELKRFKDKFDLGLITEEEYIQKRSELSKFIK